VRDLARRLRARELTALALTERTLARIKATQPVLGAFRCVRAQAALAEAAAADQRLDRGEQLPLLGVPVAIKDDVDLEGESTPFGCAGEFPLVDRDGEVARRLKAAGAVIVGKTNSPELGQWPITEGPAFGVTRNPWSRQHTPGGSSGGAAAAVAAGLVSAAIGSDGAGSVRIPAAWTHLVGVKPQRGRISTWPEPEVFNGLTCYGPLARSVGDAALMLDVLSGNRAGDRHRPEPPSEPFLAAVGRDPGRLRVAVSLQIPFSLVRARLHPELRAATERIAGRLAELGHQVVRCDPRYGLAALSQLPRMTAGLVPWVARAPNPALLDPRTLHNARLGRLLAGPPLAFARAVERPLRAQLGAVFARGVDIVLAPTTAQPPLPVGAIDGLSDWETDKVIIGACPYAWPWNVVGWPAINIPAGFTTQGLPCGAQLMGPACSEPLLLAVAAQLEGADRWLQHHPPPQGAN
jgi:amidase